MRAFLKLRRKEISMLFGELGMTSAKLAEEFVSGVLATIRNFDKTAKPPCSGGSRPRWSRVVKDVLANLRKKHGYDRTYLWLVDFIWWSDNPQRMGLAVESELDPSVRVIEDDFQKLCVFKCPVRLMVFSSDVKDTKKMAE